MMESLGAVVITPVGAEKKNVHPPGEAKNKKWKRQAAGRKHASDHNNVLELDGSKR